MKKLFFLYLCTFTFSLINFTSLPAQVQEEQVVSPAQTYSLALQSPIEIQIFNSINQNRVANFLPVLTWSEPAAEQARLHSFNMANKIVPFSHQGADLRFTALLKAIPSLTRFGENVAYNFGYSNPAATAVSGWLKSPGHYANIMGDFNLTGVGVAKSARGEYYFTQIFVKARLPTTLQTDESNLIEDILSNETLSQEACCEDICETPMLIENNDL